MKVCIGCDHGGFAIKGAVLNVLKEKGFEIFDYGVFEGETADYPDIAKKVSALVSENKCDFGVLLCGTGIGMAICANKVKGVRAAVCNDKYSAEMSRKHNNANMLALGGRVVGPDLAKMIAKIWLETPFDGGERHSRRVQMIMDIEQNQIV